MFSWDDKYKVGISEIDQQHEKLFELLHELYQAAKQGKARAVVAKVLQGVVAYTKEHFANEERLMRRYEYPDYLAHRRLHEALVKQADELVEQSKESSLVVSVDVMNFLESWLAHHIGESDRRFGSFLAHKGVR